MKLRLCIICQARVRNKNPKCNTCCPECTRIKHSGKTRDMMTKEAGKISRYEMKVNDNIRKMYSEDISTQELAEGSPRLVRFGFIQN